MFRTVQASPKNHYAVLNFGFLLTYEVLSSMA